MLKPQPDRLYGRASGHALRPRQQALLEAALPRMKVDPADPWARFPGQARWLEVGFGGGEHACALAAANPEAGLVACEVFENGICSLLSRLLPEPADPATASLPDNLGLWDDDARPLLRAVPDGTLDRLFLMFPDPWPKTRHAKRRFVHPAMVGEVARAMRPGAIWRVASDDPTYQAWVAGVLAEQDAFDTPPPADTRPDDWPPTRYEAKALRAGRKPLYWTLTRR